MGHEDEGARELEQALLEHLEGRDVEVVRGLVEEQQVGGLEHQPGEHRARLLAAREPAHRRSRAARSGRGSASPSPATWTPRPWKTTESPCGASVRLSETAGSRRERCWSNMHDLQAAARARPCPRPAPPAGRAGAAACSCRCRSRRGGRGACPARARGRGRGRSRGRRSSSPAPSATTSRFVFRSVAAKSRATAERLRRASRGPRARPAAAAPRRSAPAPCGCAPGPCARASRARPARGCASDSW